MMRTASLMVCVLAMAPALAQAPVPDLKDPAVAGRAYLDACEKWDSEAGSKLAVSQSGFARVARRSFEGCMRQRCHGRGGGIAGALSGMRRIDWPSKWPWGP